MIGYVRVSSDQQRAPDRTSPEDQRREIEQRAVELGGKVERWFEDSASGAAVDGRPGFRALLAYCERTRVPLDAPGFAIFYDESRFGRFPDAEEAAFWRVHLKRHGWHVRYVHGDDESSAAAIVRAAHATTASEYRRNLQIVTRRGMRSSGEHGYWTRPEPFGYRRQVVASARVLAPGERKPPADRVRLVPHEPEARLVRWVFETYDEGTSAGEIARRLLVEAPGRAWGPHVVLEMLRRRVYVGDIVGGRRKTQTRGLARVPYECLDAHPALIDRDLYARVQRRIEANADSGPVDRAEYVLTGILTCASCGSRYAGGGGGRKAYSAAQNGRRRLYRCTGGLKGLCPGKPAIPSVMRHVVEPAVIEIVADALADPDTQESLSAAFDGLLNDEGAPDRTSRGLRAARTRAEAKLERLAAAVADGVLTGGEAKRQVEAARAEIESVDRQLKGTRADGERRKVLVANRRIVQAITLEFQTAFEALEGPEARHEMLAAWIESCTFDKHSRELTVQVRPLPSEFPAALLKASGAFLIGDSRARD